MCWCVDGTGTFNHIGFYPLDYGGAGSLYPVSGGVLLVGSGPFDQWTGCS